MNYSIRILESPDELYPIEVFQRLIWPGSDTEVLPAHMLIAAVHNGGIVLGAYWQDGKESNPNEENKLVGFVFGFPGHYSTADGPRLKHHSHMLGVHPDHRNKGLGYLLKRAQWQIVRRQGIDRITWTYDPLLSPNAHLNISKLGAVCDTYFVNYYGALKDQLNIGYPTDRFQVDWWINSLRVNTRLSKNARPQLDFSHFQAAKAVLLNPSEVRNGILYPFSGEISSPRQKEALLLIEIPSDFQSMKQIEPETALQWRIHCRELFQVVFHAGYLVTDFIRDKNQEFDNHLSKSFYVLSYGESTL